MERTNRSRDIRQFDLDDLKELMKELGQPAFRAKQLYEWVHEKNVCSFDEMTNLPAGLRQSLTETFAFKVPTELVKQVSKDGSRKYLLEFSDGVSVETVGMPNRNKLAVCISSQAGCAMAAPSAPRVLLVFPARSPRKRWSTRSSTFLVTSASVLQASSSWARVSPLQISTTPLRHFAC